MNIMVMCDKEDCYCNKDGNCEANLGIVIEDGECTTYEPTEEKG